MQEDGINRINITEIFGKILAVIKSILRRIKNPMRGDTYTWYFDGEIEDFFNGLRIVTVQYNWRKDFWHNDPDCFVLRERPIDSFELWFQKQSVYNSFTMILYGKAMRTQNGVRIRGELRMTELVCAFLIMWLSVAFMFFIICLITLNAAIIVPIIMIVFGIALYQFGQAISNPKGIIALMDGLCSPTKRQGDE